MAKYWTEEQDKLAIKMRTEGYTIKEIAARLSRTYSATRLRLAEIAPETKQRAWTDEEVETVLSLKKLGRSHAHIARQVNRSTNSIAGLLARVHKGEKVGGSGRTSSRWWTQEEKDKLVQLRKEGLTAKEIAEHFPNRSEATIKNLLGKLLPKSLKWTEEEDSLIKDMYATGASYKEIASKFPNRTLDAVRTRIANLVKDCDKRYKSYEWNLEKRDILIKMRAEGKTQKEIAEATKTSASLVNKKSMELLKLGVVAPLRPRAKEWTEEEELLIADWRAEGRNTDFIATQLGRSYPSVAGHISRLIKIGALDPYTSTDQATKVYLVHFTEEDFYKIGITSNVWARFQGYPEYEVVEVLECASHEEAKRVEAELLSLVQPFKYTPLIFKLYGVTECFQTGTSFHSFEDLISFCQG